jgi:hypothetical protein
VADGAAGGEDDIVAEAGGEVWSQGAEGVRNPVMHRGASSAMVGEEIRPGSKTAFPG